jgi:arylsulfatase A-like enzyme
MKKNKEVSIGFISNLGIIVTGTIIFLMFSFFANAQLKSAPPNIIFIICDQMRADAIGVSGNRNAITPNLDKLANNGIICRNNLTNNSVCLPSRVSMFSGKYPNQTGIMCNKSTGDWLPFEKSLPWYLKQAGYRTAYVGKNHTFIKSEFENFDYSSIRDREEFRAYSKYVPPYWHSDILWPEEDCNPPKNTEEAIHFINENVSGQPFFLCVSYFNPHPPYMAPAEYAQHYCAKEMELPEYINPSKLGERIAEQQKALRYDILLEADLKETMRYYHASVEWGVDHQLGQIIKTLEEKGIADNTVLVFTSDHGDFMGEFNMVRKGMFLYDALLHVPMIWYAPGRIIKGLQIDNLTQNVDIFPTLLDFAGIQIPQQLVGRSLRNALQGKEPIDDEQIVFAAASYSDLPSNYWDEPEPYFNPDNNVPFHSRVENLTWKDEHETFMVRNRNWKLIVSETRKSELYFMDGGHIERENLYGKPEYQQKYQELMDKLNFMKRK